MNKYKDNYPQFDIWGDMGMFDISCTPGSCSQGAANQMNGVGQMNGGAANQMNGVGQMNAGAANQMNGGGQMNEGANTRPMQAVDENGCICGAVLATTYTKMQQFRDMYDPQEGLMRGTIFRELDKPFLGGKGRRK